MQDERGVQVDPVAQVGQLASGEGFDALDAVVHAVHVQVHRGRGAGPGRATVEGALQGLQ